MDLRRPALAWFAGSLTLFAATAARGPQWADSSKLALYAIHDYLPSLNPGDHSGWTLLARIWLELTPWWSPARSLALMSALAAASAVVGVFVFVTRRTEDPATGHTAAAVLMVAHPLWWSGTMVESYAPAFALVVATAVALTARPRSTAALLAGLTAGLAAGVHAFSLFVTMPLLLGAIRRRPWTVAAGFLVGTAPLWLGILGTPPDPLTGHLAGGTGSWTWHLRAFLDPSRAVAGAGRLAALLVLALGPVALWGYLPIRGKTALRPVHPEPAAALAGLGLLATILTVYAPYRVHLMVGFLVVGTLLVLPLKLTTRMRGLHLATQACLYTLVPLAAVAADHAALGVRVLPDRDNAWYFLSPVKALDDGAQRYAQDLLRAAPPHAVILADFNPGAVLMLVRTLNRLRPDVTVIPTAVDEALAQPDPVAALASRIDAVTAAARPAVLADTWPPYYRVEELRRRFGMAFVRCGPGLLMVDPPPPS